MALPDIPVENWALEINAGPRAHVRFASNPVQRQPRAVSRIVGTKRQILTISLPQPPWRASLTRRRSVAMSATPGTSVSPMMKAGVPWISRASARS